MTTRDRTMRAAELLGGLPLTVPEDDAVVVFFVDVRVEVALKTGRCVVSLIEAEWDDYADLRDTIRDLQAAKRLVEWLALERVYPGQDLPS